MNQAVFDPVHEKILMESVFYGLPHWELNAPITTPDTGITIDEVNPSSQPGLTTNEYQLIVSPTQEVTIPGRGTYYKLAGRTQAAIYRPIQPQASIDVGGVSGQVAHGALFTGGAYSEIGNFNPVITMPTWTRSLPEPQFLYEGWDPIRFWSLAQLERDDGTYDERLVLVPGQFLIDEDETRSSGSTVGTQRLYDSFDFEVFYAPAGEEFQPPIIKNVSAGVSSNPGVFISVQVADPGSTNPPFGIVTVVVTYTEKEDGTAWRSMELGFISASGLWEGTLPIDESINFFVQALDESGNVGMFAGNGYLTPVTVSVSAPSTAVIGQPVSLTATSPLPLSDPNYLWDFGDGIVIQGLATVFHSFSDLGIFTVEVHVVDSWGNLGEASTQITIEIVDDSSTYGAYTGLMFLTDAIQGLPPDVIRDPAEDRYETLNYKLIDVSERILEGKYKAAVLKLRNDIRKKTDGCGTTPDNNDWITNCPQQFVLQALIDNLIATLEALIEST